MIIEKGLKQNGSNGLILVCDDVADNCLFFQTILEIEGYEVDTVDSGTAALAYLEYKVPDVLLLDVMMPFMNGYEVARCIRNKLNLQKLTIFLITANEEVFLNPNLDVNVNGIIRKPVDPDVLIEYIQAKIQQTHY